MEKSATNLPDSASAADASAAPKLTSLNLKEVARQLGVHYMTAYRYVHRGLLPARKEGQGWIVDPVDLEAFRASREALDVAPAAVAPSALPGDEDAPTGRIDWRARLRVPLLAGNEVVAWDVTVAALDAGMTPQRCYLDLIAGTVALIGEDVATGRAAIADQYLATATAQRVGARLGTRFRRRGPSRGTVVLGAPTGERHALPIAIVADVIRLAGFTVLELGADVPAEAFVTAAERAERLVAVGIGVTGIDHIEEAAMVVDAVRTAHPGVPIMVGGQAVRSPEIAALVGVDAWAPDGDAVVSAIEELAAR